MARQFARDTAALIARAGLPVGRFRTYSTKQRYSILGHLKCAVFHAVSPTNAHGSDNYGGATARPQIGGNS